MITLYSPLMGANLICSLSPRISSIPRLDAPSISITSIERPSAISIDISDRGSNFALGPSSEFNAMANILAVVVLPTPLGPVKM